MPGHQVYRDDHGPRCTHCGCNDTQVMRAATAGATWPSGVALCLNERCNRTFTFSFEVPPEEFGDVAEYADEAEKPPYRVVREMLRCPQCRSTAFRTDTTRQQADGSVLRYHVCRSCQYRFSSIER